MLSCELELPDGATIAEALAAARQVLGEQAADWEAAVTGIYGRVCPREHVPCDGERIELYRPLQNDPRARPARARRGAAAMRLRRAPRT